MAARAMLLAALAVAPGAQAQAPAPTVSADPALPAPDPMGAFTFTLENDLFSGTDRYYTNGFQFTWRSPSYNPPAWLEFLTDRRSLIFPEGGQPRWGLAFGQSIFTPTDTQTRAPDPNDRPYAGWLYGAITLTSATADAFGSLELQLGAIGPAAQGKQVQNNTHDLLGIERAYGWAYQLKDEPGANLVLARAWRLNQPVWGDNLAVGLVPSIALSLGNVQTYASAGVMLRFGNDLTADFGPPRMRPAVAGSAFFEPSERWGWYAFGALEGRAVARDITLDGNTWRDSRSVEREDLVGDASLGLVVMLPRGRLATTYTFRSREFQSQRESAQFGSVSLSYRF